MFRRLARLVGLPVRPDYVWFPAESTAELSRRLNEAGPGARLEVRPDGRMKLLLGVIPGPEGNARIAALPLINNSRPCPPFCD